MILHGAYPRTARPAVPADGRARCRPGRPGQPRPRGWRSSACGSRRATADRPSACEADLHLCSAVAGGERVPPGEPGHVADLARPLNATPVTVATSATRSSIKRIRRPSSRTPAANVLPRAANRSPRRDYHRWSGTSCMYAGGRRLLSLGAFHAIRRAAMTRRRSTSTCASRPARYCAPGPSRRDPRSIPLCGAWPCPSRTMSCRPASSRGCTTDSRGAAAL